jgi:hypothetical protein
VKKSIDRHQTQENIAKEIILNVHSLSAPLPLHLFNIHWNPNPPEFCEDLVLMFPTIVINLTQYGHIKPIFTKVVAPFQNQLIILTRRQHYFALSEDLIIKIFKGEVETSQEASELDINKVLSSDFKYQKNFRGGLFSGPEWALIP